MSTGMKQEIDSEKIRWETACTFFRPEFDNKRIPGKLINSM